MCDDLIIELTWGVMSLGHRFKDDLYPLSLEDIKFLKDHETYRIFWVQDPSITCGFKNVLNQCPPKSGT